MNWPDTFFVRGKWGVIIGSRPHPTTPNLEYLGDQIEALILRIERLEKRDEEE